MGEQAIRYFLHPDFASGCWLGEKNGKKKTARAFNQSTSAAGFT